MAFGGTSINEITKRLLFRVLLIRETKFMRKLELKKWINEKKKKRVLKLG